MGRCVSPAGLFLLVIASPIAVAQAVDEICSIEGRITRAGSPIPLRKASVALLAYAGSLAITETGTDSDGRFCFVNIKPGQYRVAADQAGYMRREYGAGKWSERGSVFQLIEKKPYTANIELFPRGGIRGRVVDPDGDIAPTTRVTALRVVWFNGRRQFKLTADTDCDEAGEYKLANLPPGRYLIRATSRVQPPPPKFAGRPVDPGEAYGPTFYPGVTDVASAALVEVGPGSVLEGTNISLRRGRLYRIRGYVLRPNGGPAPGATIMLGEMSVGTVSFREESVQTAKADGSFDFPGVWGGQYFVQVRDVTGSDLEGYAIADAGGRDADFVNVRLGEVARLEGLITAPGQDLPNFNQFRVDLDPVDGFFIGPASAQVESNGAFRIARMRPGRFAVSVRGLPPTAYLKSLRYGGLELDPPIMDARYGVSGRVEIVLSNQAATLNGIAQSVDGRPFAGASVCLIPENRRSSGYRVIVSGSDGTFRMDGIIPGRYLIVAVNDLEPGAEQEPGFLTRIGGGATRVEIKEGSGEAVRLVVANY